MPSCTRQFFFFSRYSLETSIVAFSQLLFIPRGSLLVLPSCCHGATSHNGHRQSCQRLILYFPFCAGCPPHGLVLRWDHFFMHGFLNEKDASFKPHFVKLTGTGYNSFYLSGSFKLETPLFSWLLVQKSRGLSWKPSRKASKTSPATLQNVKSVTSELHNCWTH